MHLSIKNMVCDRCILAVKQELQKLDIGNCNVTLGQVETENEVPEDKLEALKKNLTALGFEMLDDQKRQLIEKIKNIIINQVHYTTEEPQQNYSQILSSALNKDYSYLSSLFSQVEGITIEKFVITQKIEKAKELLIYDQLSLGEIAYQLGYSSIAYLSNQFKRVTGLTPTYFKKVGQNKRKALDKL
jgi:AraC family transcriptional regulator